MWRDPHGNALILGWARAQRSRLSIFGWCLVLGIHSVASGKRPEPFVDNSAQIDCQAWLSSDSATDHQESLLLMQSLKRAWRRNNVLHIQVQQQHYQLQDQCGAQAVRYRLIHIEHAIEHWVIAEYTPQHVRYLILRPDINKQLVSVVPPSFSPDLMYMAILDEQVIDHTLQTKLLIWRIALNDWQAQTSIQRLQNCFACQEQRLLPRVQWLSNRRFDVHYDFFPSASTQLRSVEQQEAQDWRANWQSVLDP